MASGQERPGNSVLNIWPRMKAVIQPGALKPQRPRNCAHQSLADLCQLFHHRLYFCPEAKCRWIRFLVRPVPCAYGAEC